MWSLEWGMRSESQTNQIPKAEFRIPNLKEEAP